MITVKKVKKSPLSKNKSMAWMEGFSFEKVFDQEIKPYKIKQRETGFKLLLGNRVDYFIDYEHNLTAKYRDKINFVVVARGKKLYLAFQNTARGRKLAEQYDKMMPKLRAEGILEAIFGGDYLHSGLIFFNPIKDA